MAAGQIHGDIQKGFIKAETFSYVLNYVCETPHVVIVALWRGSWANS
jgi:ribosome-binding ATPase YchF (GTP1/OBG family)